MKHLLDSTLVLLRALQLGQRQLDILLDRRRQKVAALRLRTADPAVPVRLPRDRDTATDAANGCGMSKASVSGNVLKLATRGLLTADMDLKDRRLQHLTLTEEAGPILEDLWGLLDQMVRDALACLPPEGEAQLLKDLTAIARRLSPADL